MTEKALVAVIHDPPGGGSSISGGAGVSRTPAGIRQEADHPTLKGPRPGGLGGEAWIGGVSTIDGQEAIDPLHEGTAVSRPPRGGWTTWSRRLGRLLPATALLMDRRAAARDGPLGHSRRCPSSARTSTSGSRPPRRGLLAAPLRSG